MLQLSGLYCKSSRAATEQWLLGPYLDHDHPGPPKGMQNTLAFWALYNRLRAMILHIFGGPGTHDFCAEWLFPSSSYKP